LFSSERKIAGLFVGFERKKCSLSIKIADLSADFLWKKKPELRASLDEKKILTARKRLRKIQQKFLKQRKTITLSDLSQAGSLIFSLRKKSRTNNVVKH